MDGKTVSGIMVALLFALVIMFPCNTWAFKLDENLHASAYCSSVSAVSTPTVSSAAVYFFDVGQGDSILINTEGKNVLIDGGPEAAGSSLLGYLREVNVTHIDYMLATHSHEDHIGGLIAVMQSSITVDTILYNDQNRTTHVFQEFMALAQEFTT